VATRKHHDIARCVARERAEFPPLGSQEASTRSLVKPA